MFPPPLPPHHPPASDPHLTPDPVFMALRSAVARGPLGWISGQVAAWQERREIRREAATAVATATALLQAPTPITDDQDSAPDLAA